MTITLTQPGYVKPDAPHRSPEQRREALRYANEIRIMRAHLKRQIRDGDASAGMVLRETPEWAATMRVLDLLLAIPNVGRTKARRLLIRERVSDSKTIGGLSTRQRADLIRALAERA